MISKLRRLPRWIGYVKGPHIASRVRKWWVLFRHPHANIVFHEPVYLGPGFSLHIPDNGTFIVGPRTEFRRDFRAEVWGDGRIEIGSDCGFSYSVLIQCSTSILIGDRCQFGQSSFLVDGNHRFRDLTKPMLQQGYDYSPLRIEDDATVTTKCTIMADLGRRSFIGANSVVSKPIPPYTVAVGAPARVIEYFGPEELRPETVDS
jgi:acetyltransferase-like isoleucine patch superfamily enzyme